MALHPTHPWAFNPTAAGGQDATAAQGKPSLLSPVDPPAGSQRSESPRSAPLSPPSGAMAVPPDHQRSGPGPGSSKNDNNNTNMGGSSKAAAPYALSGEGSTFGGNESATSATTSHHRREAPRGRSLFLQGLKPSVEFPQLYHVFSRFGTLVSCRVLHDAKRGMSRGIGYVNFASDAEAARALQELTDDERARLGVPGPGGVTAAAALHSNNGNPNNTAGADSEAAATMFVIKLADHDPHFTEDDARTLSVHFVPLGVTQSQVQAVFAEFGEVVACEVVPAVLSKQSPPKSASVEQLSQPTLVAKIEFAEASHATTAAASLHRTTALGQDRLLYIKPAEPESKIKAREERKQADKERKRAITVQPPMSHHHHHQRAGMQQHQPQHQPAYLPGHPPHHAFGGSSVFGGAGMMPQPLHQPSPPQQQYAYGGSGSMPSHASFGGFSGAMALMPSQVAGGQPHQHAVYVIPQHHHHQHQQHHQHHQPQYLQQPQQSHDGMYLIPAGGATQHHQQQSQQPLFFGAPASSSTTTMYQGQQHPHSNSSSSTSASQPQPQPQQLYVFHNGQLVPVQPAAATGAPPPPQTASFQHPFQQVVQQQQQQQQHDHQQQQQQHRPWSTGPSPADGQHQQQQHVPMVAPPHPSVFGRSPPPPQQQQQQQSWMTFATSSPHHQHR